MKKVFQCDECPYAKRAAHGATVKRALFEHSLTVHGVGSSSGALHQLRLNQYSRLSPQSVACDECGAAIVTVCVRKSLTQHLGLRHPEFKHLAKRANKRVLEVACDDCARLFSTKPNLIRHQSREHGLSTKLRPKAPRKKVNCDGCPKTITKDTIHAHWLFAHSPFRSASRLQVLLPRALPSKVSCEDCGHRSYRNDLWKHWAVKHGGRRELIRRWRSPKVACDDCAGCLIRRDILLRHWHSQHRV